MSKIKNAGLNQYGTEPFEQQQFGTAGVKGLSYTANEVTKFYYKAMAHWKVESDLWYEDETHREIVAEQY